MKKNEKIYVMLFMILTVIFSTVNVNANLPLIGKIIIIDPGHGGVDPGSVYNQIYEKDINLEISKKIEEELIKLGATIILTRNNDYDLSSPGVTWRKQSDFDNRIKLINNSNADMYLSIHMNYLNDESYGETGIYYLENEQLAEIIQKNINKYFNYKREIKKIPESTYMYTKLNITGVLIECGFLSNSKDRENFQNEEFIVEFSKVIAASIAEYY